MNVDYWPWALAYTRTQFRFGKYFRIVYANDAAYCLDNICKQALK